MQSKQRDPEINISNLKLTKYTFTKKFRQKSKQNTFCKSHSLDPL